MCRSGLRRGGDDWVHEARKKNSMRRKALFFSRTRARATCTPCVTLSFFFNFRSRSFVRPSARARAPAMSIDVDNFVRDMDAIINGDAEDDGDERREDAPSDHWRAHDDKFGGSSRRTLAPSSPPATAEAKDPLDSWETVRLLRSARVASFLAVSDRVCVCVCVCGVARVRVCV